MTIKNLIEAIVEEKPLSVKNELSDLMLDRIRDILDEKRAEVAQRFFEAAGDGEDEDDWDENVGVEDEDGDVNDEDDEGPFEGDEDDWDENVGEDDDADYEDIDWEDDEDEDSKE